MPNWKFHNIWAVKFGIPLTVSNWVNKREDLPHFESTNDKSLVKFKKLYAQNPPTYNELKDKGDDYLKAWMLHLIIDDIEDAFEFYKDEQGDKHDLALLYENIANYILNNSFFVMIPDELQSFVKDNITQIIKTLPNNLFRLINN